MTDSQSLILYRMDAASVALMRAARLNRGQAYWLCVRHGWAPLTSEAVATYAAECRTISAYIKTNLQGTETNEPLEVFG